MDKQLSGFKYYVYDNPANEKERFKIITPNNRQEPEILYKYYSLETYNIEAVINHYLYANHPRELNDPYDCFQFFLDFNDLTLEQYKEVLLDRFSEIEIDYLFRNNKKALSYEYAKDFHLLVFSKIGIVSLTTDGLSSNMWNYYCKYEGFNIALETRLLPNSFSGPFPMNYKDSFDKLSISQVDPRICVLYQTNVKSSKWIGEDEWRYLITSKKVLKIPGLYLHNTHNRKFFYNIKAISEITLGFYFFNESELSLHAEDEILLSLKNKKKRMKSRRKLLDFIVKNSIKTYWIRLSTINFKLNRLEIKLSKLSTNKFLIKYVG